MVRVVPMKPDGEDQPMSEIEPADGETATDAESVETPPDAAAVSRRSGDFLVIMVLIALVAVAAASFAAGWALGRDDAEPDDTFAHELATFTECLAEEGATVPEVTPDRDGGFTVEFAAGFFEDFEPASLLGAAGECASLLPIGEVLDVLGLDVDLLDLAGLLELEGLLPLEELMEGRFDRFDRAPEFFLDERLRDLLEELAAGDLRPGELLDRLPPGQLRRLCALADDIESLGDDGIPLELLERACAGL